MPLDEQDVEQISTAMGEVFDEKWDKKADKLKTDIVTDVRTVVIDAVDRLTAVEAPTSIAKRVRQHQRWLQRIADKIGIKLES